MTFFCETKDKPRAAYNYVTATVLQFKPNAVICYYINILEIFSF